jgi:hypothetical protein
MALTYAQKQMAKRRSGDINRLTSDYQRAVEQYKTNVGGKEQAFQAEMAKYNEAFGGYEQRSTAYQKRLLDYMDRMKAYQSAPMQTLASQVYYGRAPGVTGYMYNTLGDRYNPYRAQNYSQARSIPAGYEFVNTNPAVPYFGDIIGKSVANPGAFTEKFEEQAPAAPAAMDISAERTALQGEKDYTEREIEERKKARLRAVGRGSQRGMLSAGTNISAKE